MAQQQQWQHEGGDQGYMIPFRFLPTFPTTWDPSSLPPPLNVRLDGCIVPSEASPQGARIAFSQLVVMDDFIGEAQRAELLHFLIGTSGGVVGGSRGETRQQQQEEGEGDGAVGKRRGCAGSGSGNAAGAGVEDHPPGGSGALPSHPPLTLPPTKWERRTTDMAGAAPSWGVRPAVLAELARMELPAMREVHARLCKLLPEYRIALLPSECIQGGGERWGAPAAAAASPAAPL